MDRQRQWLASLLLMPLAVGAPGCMFGPRVLENTHARYNESIKQVSEEQALLNLVRGRYNDDLMRLDVSSIAAQYELGASAEARPFFATESNSAAIRSFSTVLPFVGLVGSNRPTISLTPLDDPETLRSLFTPSTLDGIIFLSEASYPVATVFRIWVEYLNGLPNAVTASGPPRGILPEFRAFQRVTELLQLLKDREDARFVRTEKITELGDPLPPEAMTAAAQVEAAKNGQEYRQRPDKRWVLLKRDRRLELRINPRALTSPDVLELCQLLQLQPGLDSYEVTIGTRDDLFAQADPPVPTTRISLFPRSTVQAFYYLAHGVLVPLEHVKCGIVQPALQPDGSLFDWQQVTAELFTVYHVNQPCRPKQAYVAVKYRDYWFYLDDRDTASKITFSLMMTMSRVNLFGVRKGAPALTLPVGR